MRKLVAAVFVVMLIPAAALAETSVKPCPGCAQSLTLSVPERVCLQQSLKTMVPPTTASKVPLTAGPCGEAAAGTVLISGTSPSTPGQQTAKYAWLDGSRVQCLKAKLASLAPGAVVFAFDKQC